MIKVSLSRCSLWDWISHNSPLGKFVIIIHTVDFFFSPVLFYSLRSLALLGKCSAVDLAHHFCCDSNVSHSHRCRKVNNIKWNTPDGEQRAKLWEHEKPKVQYVAWMIRRSSRDRRDNNTLEVTNMIKLSCKRSTLEDKIQCGDLICPAGCIYRYYMAWNLREISRLLPNVQKLGSKVIRNRSVLRKIKCTVDETSNVMDVVLHSTRQQKRSFNKSESQKTHCFKMSFDTQRDSNCIFKVAGDQMQTMQNKTHKRTKNITKWLFFLQR